MEATMTSYRLLVIGGVLVSTSCSTILGANFNVDPEGAGGGSGVSAATTSGSVGDSSSGNGGGPSCLPDACKPELVSDEDNPFGIAAFGDSVYWANRGSTGVDGAIKRSMISAPGAPPQVLVKDLVNPNQVAVTANHVYWTSTAASGGVYCVPLAGASAAQFVAEGQPGPIGILVDDANVYWTSANGTVRSSGLGCAPVPPAATTLATGLDTPALLAKNTNGSIFVTEYLAKGRLMRIDPANDTPVEVLIALPTPDGIVARGSAICFATAVDDGGVYCVDGGPGVTTMAMHQSFPATLTVDRSDSTLYWVNSGNGTIMKATLFGTSAVQVASGQLSPNGVAVAGDYVYWTNHMPKENGGSVMRIRIH
jgi:sugar lactone lactonase YvrE